LAVRHVDVHEILAPGRPPCGKTTSGSDQGAASCCIATRDADRVFDQRHGSLDQFHRAVSAPAQSLQLIGLQKAGTAYRDQFADFAAASGRFANIRTQSVSQRVLPAPRASCVTGRHIEQVSRCTPRPAGPNFLHHRKGSSRLHRSISVWRQLRARHSRSVFIQDANIARDLAHTSLQTVTLLHANARKVPGPRTETCQTRRPLNGVCFAALRDPLPTAS